MNTILINETQYPVKFGLNALRNYCNIRNIDFDQFQAEVPEMMSGNMSFLAIDNLALLIGSAIREGIRKQKSDIQPPDIEDIIELFEKPDEFTKVMELFTGSLPQAEEGKN